MKGRQMIEQVVVTDELSLFQEIRKIQNSYLEEYQNVNIDHVIEEKENTYLLIISLGELIITYEYMRSLGESIKNSPEDLGPYSSGSVADRNMLELIARGYVDGKRIKNERTGEIRYQDPHITKQIDF